MANGKIRIGSIKTISPALAETLGQCWLRAELSVAPGTSEYVVGNPKAWFGRAYRAVMEGVAPAGSGNDEEACLGDAWNTAIERGYGDREVILSTNELGLPSLGRAIIWQLRLK